MNNNFSIISWGMKNTQKIFEIEGGKHWSKNVFLYKISVGVLFYNTILWQAAIYSICREYF